MKNRPVTLGLLIANIVCFVIFEAITGGTSDPVLLFRWGGGYIPAIRRGEYYRLFTSMFLHADFRHLVNNMILLSVMGIHLEKLLGSVKFLILYILGGLAASYVSYIYYLRSYPGIVFVGASGAIFAVIGALLFIILRERGSADGLNATQIIVILAFSLYFGLTNAMVSNAAHIAGFAAGFILGILLYRRRGPKKQKPYQPFESGGGPNPFES